MLEKRMSYQDLKTLILGKNLKWNHEENDQLYDIFSKEGIIVYSSRVYKAGKEPRGFNVSQNTTDRTDFEGNYKSGANTPDAGTTKPQRMNTLVYGQTDVATAGSAIILASAADSDTVTVKAKTINSGMIFIGDNLVTSSNGFILEPGASISMDINHNDVNIYIDAETSGEGVSFIFGTIS